jgi:putative transposase
MKTEEQNKLERLALGQFMSGKSFFGKDGVFTPMLQNFIEKSITAEMDSHLSKEGRFYKGISVMDMVRKRSKVQ